MWPFRSTSLFWKIFAWFWLSMMAMALVSVFVLFAGRNEPQVFKTDQKMQGVMQQVVRIVESDLALRLKQRRIMTLLQPLQPPARLRDEWRRKGFRAIYFIDEEMKDRRGNPVPKIMQRFLQEGEAENKTVLLGNASLIIGPTLNFLGEPRRIIMVQHVGAFQLRFIAFFLQSLSLFHITLYLSTSALLCFFLAYRLTRPVQQLKTVIRQIKEGQKVSAVEAIGKRKDEFKELAQSFDEMTSTTENTIKAQKQLLSDVSHELRSPLTRMRLAANLLAKKSRVTSPHLEQIEKDCQVMDEMIAQLLDIAALERGQVTEQKQQFEIESLLEELIADVKYEAEEKLIILNIKNKVRKQTFFEGYYGLLRSALENIIRNAIRHSPEKSAIDIGITQEKSMISISVIDQGGGVDSANVDKIFDAFYRTDEARTRHQGGSGLGLTIAKRAVEANGGVIAARNIVNKSNIQTGLQVDIKLVKES